MANFTGGVLLFPDTAGDQTKLIALEFDCVVDEQHEVSSEITEYPVETGFVIADHAIKKNRKLALNIIVGNTANLPKNVNTLANSGLEYTGSEVVAVATGAQEAHDYLSGCVMEGKACKVSTIYGNYNNAIITNYTTKQDGSNLTVLVAKLEITDVYQYTITGGTAAKSSTVEVTEQVDSSAQAAYVSTPPNT